MSNQLNSSQDVASPEVRVIAYVDGFNLYHGLKQAGFKRYYWLDLPAMVSHLLKPHQKITKVKFFTSRVIGPKTLDQSRNALELKASRARQNSYIEALCTNPIVQLIEGKYQEIQRTCKFCNRSWQSNEEKMTDVGIATELLVDAIDDKFDTAILVSGDSDLVPPMRVIRNRLKSKSLIAAFPPNRYSNELAKIVNGVMHINENVLRRSQLPNTLTRADGYLLRRPIEWS